MEILKFGQAIQALDKQSKLAYFKMNKSISIQQIIRQH